MQSSTSISAFVKVMPATGLVKEGVAAFQQKRTPSYRGE